MRIEILTVGGEILVGRTLDTNFHFLARSLARLGTPPAWHTTVPDVREMISAALETAMARADCVIMTGGLGGTPDDLTRRVLSQVLGRPLVLREEVLRDVEEVYRRRGRIAPPAAQAMALVPNGAQMIANPVGLAPGLILPTPRGGSIIALPGVPEEMKAQVEQFVLPMLERQLGGSRVTEVVLRTAGVPESVLAESLGQAHPAGCDVAYLPHWGGVDLCLVRSADAPSSSEEFRQWADGIRERLDDAVYATGDESLEQAVGRLLLERGLRLAVAESLTGGGVGAALTRVPGSSAYFLGSIVAYDNDVKVKALGVSRATLLNHGAVSAATAEEMASGVRRFCGSDLAVSTTGIAGPSGGSDEKPVGLVYLGLASAQGLAHVRRLYPGRTREGVVARSIQGVLWLLYRHLRGLKVDDRFPDRGGEAGPGRDPGR